MTMLRDRQERQPTMQRARLPAGHRWRSADAVERRHVLARTALIDSPPPDHRPRACTVGSAAGRSVTRDG